MADPSSSLGIDFDFPTEEVSNGLRFAMQMAAPNDTSLQATFVFPATGATYSKGGSPVVDPLLDGAGKPLDPDVLVTQTVPDPVQVDCVVEIVKADAGELPVGRYAPTKAVVTVLGDQYDEIVGCKELQFNGDRYAFGYEPDGVGLFDLDVHTMVFFAMDES